ncbi:hypothetical protein [Bacillus cabrialesii]|uniref:hypothetical protein n=1 Tax=Bacillus cabrialesii TaxID=2487276 RepID=UPI0028F9DEE5|nr:hypothetical protein [Bacillus cabrialesii]MDU0153640.1 hypothetical protein [Bacillus cabrialesii]
MAEQCTQAFRLGLYCFSSTNIVLSQFLESNALDVRFSFSYNFIKSAKMGINQNLSSTVGGIGIVVRKLIFRNSLFKNQQIRDFL